VEQGRQILSDILRGGQQYSTIWWFQETTNRRWAKTPIWTLSEGGH